MRLLPEHRTGAATSTTTIERFLVTFSCSVCGGVGDLIIEDPSMDGLQHGRSAIHCGTCACEWQFGWETYRELFFVSNSLHFMNKRHNGM